MTLARIRSRNATFPKFPQPASISRRRISFVSRRREAKTKQKQNGAAPLSARGKQEEGSHNLARVCHERAEIFEKPTLLELLFQPPELGDSSSFLAISNNITTILERQQQSETSSASWDDWSLRGLRRNTFSLCSRRRRGVELSISRSGRREQDSFCCITIGSTN